MAYTNVKTGVDECPITKTEFVASMYRMDMDIWHSQTCKKDRFPFTPYMLTIMGNLTDYEKQFCLHPSKVKPLARRLGYPSIRSGLWGAAELARRQVQSRLGQGAVLKIEKTPGSRAWGLFATSLQAITEFEKHLKFNVEQLIGRSL